MGSVSQPCRKKSDVRGPELEGKLALLFFGAVVVEVVTNRVEPVRDEGAVFECGGTSKRHDG